MGFLGDVDKFFFERGEDIADFLPHVIHHASNFACTLYKNNPGVIYDLNYFNKGLWEKLCRPRDPGLPPAPPAPFQGGQCDFYYILRMSAPNGTVVEATGNPIKGPISSIGLDWIRHPRLGTWGWRFLVGSPQVLSAETYTDGRYMINGSATYNQSEVRPGLKPTLLGVRPRDGQPDTCGDPVRPPVPPVVLPEPDRTVDITYTFDDGVEVTFPVVLIFPTLNNTFKLAPSLTFKANVNNNISINLHLLPDGFHSEPDADGGDDSESPDLDYYFHPPDPEDDPLLKPTPPTPPASFGGDEDVPAGRWLLVTLTKFPDKAQYGKNTPNVYFAGWMEFLKGGACFERQQINFEKSLFRFPDGATGFYVQFTNGAQGSYIVYTEDSTNA